MIKANELRIGNFVLDKKGVITEILEIEFDDNDLWDPIPLTPEILESCGFKNEDVNRYCRRGITIYQKRAGIDGRNRFALLSNDYNPELETVHQLQNLYFALTDEELEFKQQPATIHSQS